MEQEIWKEIEGYEGKYMISSLGRVKSMWRCNQYGHKIDNETIIVPHKNRNYLRVCLSLNNVLRSVYVHRLVAEAFIPNPDNLPQINHKDENPLNNSSTNLEWCDPKYNSNYGTRMERIKQSLKAYGKQIIQYDKIGRVVGIYRDIFEVKEINPTYTIGRIERVLRGDKHRHTAYGYKWSGGVYT